eukprot:gene9556-12904_t
MGSSNETSAFGNTARTTPPNRRMPLSSVWGDRSPEFSIVSPKYTTASHRARHPSAKDPRPGMIHPHRPRAYPPLAPRPPRRPKETGHVGIPATPPPSPASITAKYPMPLHNSASPRAEFPRMIYSRTLLAIAPCSSPVSALPNKTARFPTVDLHPLPIGHEYYAPTRAAPVTKSLATSPRRGYAHGPTQGRQTMTFGLSLPAFTELHVIISLIGIAAGLVFFAALIAGRWLALWCALFLAFTILTSVTGFLFPPKPIGPPFIFGV